MGKPRADVSLKISETGVDMQKGSSASRNSFIDGWRGVSVICVFIVHLFFYHWPLEFKSLRLTATEGTWFELLFQVFIRPLSSVGELGVPVFFLISGYIITRLLTFEEKEFGNINIAAFYIRRTFRIFPALACFILAIAALHYAGVIEINPVSYLGASTFTCNVYQCDWWLAHLWSLGVEEQFYLAWPLLFSWLAPKRYQAIVLVTIVLFLLSIYFQFARPFVFIAVGAYYAVLQERYGDVVIPSFIPIFATVSLFLGSFVVGSDWRALLEIFRPFLVAGIFFGSFNFRPIRWLVDRTWLSAVGRVSYGLYLWQQLFTAPMNKYLLPVSDLFLLLLPVIVILLYFAIERPMIGVGRKISARFVAKTKAA
jgi:peptidoglycan/LPS O-acetylase OafA/YrhL